MKIAYVVPGLDPTGPIFIVKSLVDVLTKMGHDVKVFYLVERKNEMEFGCPVYKILPSQRINFENFDIVHSHCFKADRYVSKWRKSFYNKSPKWVTTIHQDTKKSFTFIYPNIIANLLTKYWLRIQNKADGVVAISELIRKVHRPFISTTLKTIYNGIDVVAPAKISYRQQHTIDTIKSLKKSNKYLVGTYANIVERKGLDQVLRTMKINDKFDFVVIGDGPYKKQLLEMTEKMSLSERVHFLPFVSNPYICIKTVDVYVMPSYSEGFGLSMLEAAAMGLPIVCSNIPSFHELFSEDDAVFFELNDDNELSTSLDRAYANAKYYSNQSIKCAQLYSKENMTESHLDFYKSLMNK